MNEKFEKLKTLLKELFQLDQPDLDFGLYRIMHAKAAEVTQFLDKDLLPQVKEAFSLYRSADKAELEKDLAAAVGQARELGVDPETTQKVKDLRARLKSDALDVDRLENEVYDDLFRFFRRYYAEGDFIAKRVYKPGVYAIPYEGEELKLHWANRDQHYIKTSEYLRDYSFRLRPETEQNPMRVHSRPVDVSEGEHGNARPVEGRERLFILAEGAQFVTEENGELSIRFEYRSPTMGDWPDTLREAKSKPPAQKDLLASAVERVLAVQDAALFAWISELAKPHTRADGEPAEYSRLEAHLRRYTARNTFDYFIHKDLAGFLSRELDFYIKNEVMHLDDVEDESASRVDQYISKIRVIRRIATKLISFLAQLENFEKKLWLKKKFVTNTSYCVTLDHIPEELYAHIVASDAQREEWLNLFAIDELKGDLVTPGYSKPLSIQFLKANKYLLLDTRHFPDSFIERLLANIDNVDRTVDGTLIHSDNFQALCLLQTRFHERVGCVYLDPPYNTSSSSIPYKNNYRHSSWATMMSDRLASLYPMLTEDAAMFVSIDKTERTVLEHVMDDVFAAQNRVEELIWSMNTTNSQVPNYSTNHEYVEVYARNRHVAEQNPNMFREPKPGFEEVMTLLARLNPSYPPVAQIEPELRKLYDQHRIEFRQQIADLGLDWETEEVSDPWRGLFNYVHAEYRDRFGKLVPEGEAREKGATIWVWQEGDASMPATKQAASTGDREHPNWRFYKPLHPITGKPCPHPKSGWKFAYADDADSPNRRSFVSLDRDGRIAWGPDEHKVPRLKRMLHEVETNIGKSVFQDYSDGEKQTSAMFGRSGVFLAPKHADFVSRFILHSDKTDGVVLDCFGGSGSTAHAVIKLNRADHQRRKYLLVEVANYFDTVMKPRVLKAAYSSDWRQGKPVSRDGVSHFVKVVRLESYEDSLNNLAPLRSQTQQLVLDTPGGKELREQYLLQYMLEVETRSNQSLLNIQAFKDPTAYKLKVKRPGSDESREVNIDLLETFNYLIGLTVQHIAAPQGFTAEFERDSEKRLRLKDHRLKENAAGPWWFRTVTGTLPDGRRTLVIWRKLTGNPEQDNLALDEWFTKQGYSTKDYEFQLIYVNGDSNLENLKAADDTWKVRLIEEDFHRLMFDTEGF